MISIGSGAEADTQAHQRFSWFSQINSGKHFPALRIYVAILIAHAIEHTVQAFQIYVLDMPRTKAGGFIGYLLPAVNKDEVLHWTYAVLMIVGLILLRPGFKGRSRKWWTIALGIQIWHFAEHTFLLAQYWSGMHFLGRPVPTSVVQAFFPRVELHLIYNMAVMLPILAALSLHWFGPAAAGSQGDCDCRSHFR
ncbi:hypothetical protein ACFXK0_15350 [Nocardia sp. NPDC059177]|uniref:hypothetical protein n=1 Tax=Nocardia sp. NPDC059177 TaxID=3346759 RepID=UPI0036A3E3F5